MALDICSLETDLLEALESISYDEEVPLDELLLCVEAQELA
jgi:hypothetical protein